MYTRIGVDPSGTGIVVDTEVTRRRIALVAGVGGAKTTTCRFLARRWAAQEDAECVVLTPRVHEYANLHRDNVHVLATLDDDPDAFAASDLLIVDEAELLDYELLDYVLDSTVNTAIVASYGPAVERRCGAFTDVFALQRKAYHGEPARCGLGATGAVDVLLDEREPWDYPQHRWMI